MADVWNYSYFTKTEMRCRGGCGDCLMDPAFMDKLQTMRRSLDKPMIVSSGYRCPDHNNKVSKTGMKGPHTTGHAVDILILGHDAFRLIELATEAGMQGIGVSQKGLHNRRFIHVDDLFNGPNQPRPWIWSY